MVIKLPGFFTGEEKVKTDVYNRLVIPGAGFTLFRYPLNPR